MTRRDGVVRLEGAVRVDARVRACARASRVPSRRRRQVTKPVEEMRETTRRPRGGMALETRVLQKHHYFETVFMCECAKFDPIARVHSLQFPCPKKINTQVGDGFVTPAHPRGVL